MKATVSRRTLLKGSLAVGAGLTIGFRAPLGRIAAARAQDPGVFAPIQ